MFSISHYYPWNKVPEETMEAVFAEFEEQGCSEMVLTSILLEKIMAEPAFLLRLMRMAGKHNIRFTDAHGLWGPALGLGAGARFSSLIEPMITAHRLAIILCSDLGCRTCTIHIGAYEHICFGTPVPNILQRAAEALNILLPEAEKRNLILTLENNCDNTGNADALEPLFRKFASPWFGCCFDIGHAHYLIPEPGLQRPPYESGIEQQFCLNPLEKLAPFIVTAHLHDNDKTGDWHRLPGHGTIDWKTMLPTLQKCPLLQSLQSEVNLIENQVSVRQLVDTFQHLLNTIA